MDQLTQMELLQVQELLGAVELAAKKAMVYSGQMGDGELQHLAGELADRHRQQISLLVDQLRRHSGKPGEVEPHAAK